ncbi:MAG: tail fiber domain-containing protein [Leclercia adecarboxylata]|nr:tail fiber domain-containing protein [Leclercia adecarboxylata]MDU1082929.1 tail fiber domain-containing protein [Leclercia adecarboxylata]
MTKYATMNPLGSTSPYDLFDNSQNFDTAINSITAAIWQDRLGRTRHTWYGLEQMAKAAIAAFGYITMDSFQDGATLTLPNQVLRDTSTGEYYRWDGSFLPSGKIVPPGSTPASSGGIGIGAWLSVGDAVLRGELANPAIGDALIALKQPFSGAVTRTQHDKNAEHISPLEAGAVGDAITNDTAAFAILEAQTQYDVIDLLGKTYLVDTLPTVHRYINGYLNHSVDGYVYDANPESLINVGNRNILLGGAGASMPDWVKYRGPLLAYNVFAIGFEALHKNIKGRNVIAIGAGALHEMENGRYNIAIGLESQFHCNSDDGANFTGTRNTSVGDNSMRFNVTGFSNIAVGRNAGQPFNGNYNSILGAGAVAGLCPQDLDDETIVNPSPSAISETAIFGTNAGLFLSGGYGQILIGKDAGYNIKSGIRNIGIGWNVMKTLDEGCSYDGMTKVTVAITGTYTISGGVITISASGTGAVVGGRVLAKLGTHEQNYYRITSMPNANTIVAATAYTSITEAGSCSVMEVESITSYGAQSQDNVGIGNHVMESATKTTSTAAVGAFSCRYLQGAVQVASLGAFSLGNLQTGGQVTAVGYGAGRFMQDGTNAIALTNVTLLGANTSVSGNNQVQIGNTTTTTHVYGTVQNRSDERDKADIRDTELGIEFILGLRPVDGRWDMRDDYIEFYPDAPEKPEAPVEPEAPPPPSEEQIPNLSTESDAGLYGQDPENIRIYHLDGDPTNPYSRVIETGESGISDDHQGEYPEDDYPRLLAIYLQERAAYESNMAQYQADLITYKNDCALWEAECERIKEHNARVATGELRDGSKKRERFHHWFIAQEVKELCDKLGVDFGGYQDHSVDGGCDVLSLGYDEFIPPTVRAVQQCWERMDALEARLAKLESQ